MIEVCIGSSTGAMYIGSWVAPPHRSTNPSGSRTSRRGVPSLDTTHSARRWSKQSDTWRV